MATPEYWADEWEPGKTAIHCKIGIAHVVGVLDGTPAEVYNLPEEALEAIKDRLYALCVERHDMMWRSIRDARAEV